MTDTSDKKQAESPPKGASRRDFFKFGAAGAAAGALAIAKAPGKVAAEATESIEKIAIQKNKDFPFEINKDYKPFSQVNVIQGGGPLKEHPELFPKLMEFVLADFEKSRPGYTQLDYALRKGGFALKYKMLQEEHKHDQHRLNPNFMPGPPGKKVSAKKPSDAVKHLPSKRPASILEALNADFVHDERYQFETKRDAAKYIKRAARLYGADLVGITRRDRRFDYDPLWDSVSQKVYRWEDIPFEPKTVIVMAFEMDYDAYAAAPTMISAAATGNGYSKIAKTAYQLSVFLKNLGYMALHSENDLGLNVPYSIMAGLGEFARNGCLITPKFGPRVRIGKVYTDLDFVELDSPIKFGVVDFCTRCMRCADACPPQAITKHPEPTFKPTFEDDKNWYLNPGAKKFYNNTLKCFDYWCESGGCGSCITSCPYNKPDFWHHRLVHGMNSLVPGPMHEFMREMDKIFGYGNTFDEKAMKRFWNSKKT